MNINFKNGLPGFEELHDFSIKEVEENDLFSLLQSEEDKNISMVITTPFFARKDYEFELGKNDLEELKIKSKEDILIYNTVTLNEDIKKITINLKAPIIINKNKNLGKQIVLNNEKYLIKFPLLGGE